MWIIFLFLTTFTYATAEREGHSIDIVDPNGYLLNVELDCQKSGEWNYDISLTRTSYDPVVLSSIEGVSNKKLQGFRFEGAFTEYGPNKLRPGNKLLLTVNHDCNINGDVKKIEIDLPHLAVNYKRIHRASCSFGISNIAGHPPIFAMDMKNLTSGGQVVVTSTRPG